MVEVIFFDVGGVLLDMTGPERRSIWTGRLDISETELCEAVWDAIGFRGKDGLAEVMERISEGLHVPLSEVPRLLEDFSAHWIRNDELVEFLRDQRASHRLAIIGNIPSSGRFSFETVLDLDDVFEAMFLSGELGVEKPDPRIYAIACEQMDVAPERSLFVDDRPENVHGARQFGINAHQHVSNPDTIAWVQRNLV